MVMRAVEGIQVNDETLAFDLIKQVGPGGNFVTAKHTRQFMRLEHYQPALSDRHSRDEWETKGSQTVCDLASEKVRQLLANKGHRLPDEVRNKIITEIDGIVS
jgi:trimethylamine--corrinoid protein Co-methyltransferase